MDTPIVRYQPFDGTDGIELECGALTAWQAGEPVGGASTPNTPTLDELLGSYLVPALLPDLSFSYTEPIELAAEIEPGLTAPGEINGYITFEGERKQAWTAQQGRHPDFTHTDELPAGARPWAAGDPVGEGYELILPPNLLENPDPVFRQRAALAIEAFVYDACLRRLTLPYRRAVTNVFSAAHPAWAPNIPRVLSLQELNRDDSL